MNSNKANPEKLPTKLPTLGASLLPILLLVGLMAVNVFIFKSDSTYGPNQIALILAAGFAIAIAIKSGRSWEYMLENVVNSIKDAMPAILILLLIGSVIGTWMLSGVVPAMIYYGLDLINPSIFLFASVLISAIVSVATGSSWTTAATIGVALMGIGTVLGINPGLIAGAVISGAYFGDKMSPLSDTTNLAPAMAGTDLFTHIRYMVYTTGPSIGITLIIFLFLGFGSAETVTLEKIQEVQTAIGNKINVTPWLFLVPLLVVFMIAKKVPAIPALLIGAIAGSIFAVIFQSDILMELGKVYVDENLIDESTITRMTRTIIVSWYGDIALTTENEMVDSLLKSDGMFGMMNTVWLTMSAMIFGGAMDGAGFLKKISTSILKLVSNQGSLVTATAASCGIMNATASDQYVAIVVPGRMFKSIYKEKGLAPENLSRTLEDSGTVTSVLVPWNTCAAYHSKVLGIVTGQYWMFCFFNLISPLMTILFAYLDIKIRKLKPTTKTVESETQKV